MDAEFEWGAWIRIAEGDLKPVMAQSIVACDGTREFFPAHVHGFQCECAVREVADFAFADYVKGDGIFASRQCAVGAVDHVAFGGSECNVNSIG